MKLRLGDKLEIPLDAVTQTFGILAVRGAGKSNLAAVMAEEMHKARLPFVVIDPVGAWWGLRSSSDGKAGGLPIAIFGGRHGDVPLEKTGGAVLADFVVDERASCVLDVSEFSEGDKIRFLIDFAERLFKRNAEPLHLFLEEADDYIPQQPFREQARLLRAWQNIVRRGRSRGLGITLITQRSASVNKGVLTQIETLFVLRTTSPQDRKAVAGWIQYHGQSLEMLSSLDKLGPGEAWVWSPAWLKRADRVQVRRRSTFDSGATPKQLTGKRPPATLAEVDLGKVRKLMAATIERAKADDPGELRRRIAELERAARRWYKADGSFVELAADEVIRRRIAAAAELERAGAKKDPAAVTRAFRALALGMMSLEAELSAAGLKTPSVFDDLRASGEKVAPPTFDEVNRLFRKAGGGKTISEVGVFRDPAKDGPPGRLVAVATRRSDGAVVGVFDESRDVGKGERAILIAAAQNPAGVTREQLTVITGYKRSSRDTYLQRLTSKGFLEARGDEIVATELGISKLGGSWEPLPTGTALREYWLERLPAGERRILDAAIKAYPMAIHREDLSELTGYKRSSRDTYIQRLTSRRLLLVSTGGGVIASETLFR